MKDVITIGKLASASSVNIETIRFYERKGVLKQPKKQGAFRYYPEEYIFHIRFIKRLQELGFSLDEAKELLELSLKKQTKCGDVLNRTEQKIIEINHKINDLKHIKKTLEVLTDCCEDKTIALGDCSIFEIFMDDK